MVIDANVAAVIVAAIAAIGSITTAIITLKNKDTLKVIHVLVNSRLQEMIARAIAAETEVERLKAAATEKTT